MFKVKKSIFPTYDLALTVAKSEAKDELRQKLRQCLCDVQGDFNFDLTIKNLEDAIEFKSISEDDDRLKKYAEKSIIKMEVVQ